MQQLLTGTNRLNFNFNSNIILNTKLSGGFATRLT